MISGKVSLSSSLFSFRSFIQSHHDIAPRYKIRGEKGLLRDPTTGKEGPNRKQIRYTELADEMVEKLGRLGQKAKKVCSGLSLCFFM